MSSDTQPDGTQPDGTRPDKVPARARRSRNSLSRREIVDGALTLIGRDGYYGLSMAKLARELGCAPMSLYSHIDDKPHLLDLVVHQVLADVYVPDPKRPWADEVPHQMRDIRRSLHAHPGLGRILAEGKIRSSTIDDLLEAGLACLRANGLTQKRAVRTYFSLLTFTLGSIVHESPRVYERPRSQFVARWDERESEWPAGAYPQLRKAMPYLYTVADDEQFEFSFAALLDGLVRAAAPVRPTD